MIGLRSWLARVVLGRRAAPTRRRLRRGPDQCPDYRAWIRTFQCCACGERYGVEACHTGPHALGRKSPDKSCIPLCAECHRTGQYALHRIGPVKFQRRWTISFRRIIAELNREWRQNGTL